MLDRVLAGLETAGRGWSFEAENDSFDKTIPLRGAAALSPLLEGGQACSLVQFVDNIPVR
ncbi:MAG: hypothetical protein MI861_19225 [Pirellulales bacterium]|nr:hypothetical protein [Pirellulales bacterium]